MFLYVCNCGFFACVCYHYHINKNRWLQRCWEARLPHRFNVILLFLASIRICWSDNFWRFFTRRQRHSSYPRWCHYFWSNRIHELINSVVQISFWQSSFFEFLFHRFHIIDKRKTARSFHIHVSNCYSLETNKYSKKRKRSDHNFGAERDGSKWILRELKNRAKCRSK